MNGYGPVSNQISRVAMVLLAFAACSGPAVAQAEYWVGSGVGCTHRSIQEAINASSGAGMTPVVINVTSQTPDGVYDGQAIQIANRHLTIWGGWSQCRQVEPWVPGHQVVSGGAAAPVIRVRNNAIVHLRGLDIQAGDPPEAMLQAGGVDWNATGRLTIDTTIIENNTGMLGGGLRFHRDGSGAPAELAFGANTYIQNNVALDGGGLYLSGNTTLTMTAPYVFFHNNVANPGSGGAIYIAAPARATIASPDPTGGALGVFRSNQAPLGSGGAVFLGNYPGVPGDSRVALYSAEPTYPLSFVLNTADQGGSMFVDSNADGGAVVCTHGLHVRDSSARDGAIAVVSGDEAAWRGDRAACPEIEGVPPCPAVGSSRCNLYQGNVAAEAIVRANNGAVAYLDGVRLTSNVATTGTLLASGPNTDPSSDTSLLSVTRSLIDSNQARALVSAQAGTASVIQTTVASNNENPALNFRVLEVASGRGRVFLENSVVRQTTPLGNAAGSQQISVSRTLSRNFNAVYQPGPNENIVGNAVFADAAFRLDPTSPGIDRIENTDMVDIDGNAVNVDEPSVPNGPGNRVGDLGAYERQGGTPSDAVFANGFEPQSQ
jgi:hypothetical protein